MTLYKKELKEKADEFKNILSKNNMDIIYDESSFRDYLLMLILKIGGQKKGNISLYYKPSKNTFSLKNKIDDRDIEIKVNNIWDRLNGIEIHDAESGIYEAFVDGSYISGITGYGAVIYLGNELKTKIYGTIEEVEFRQFGGELKSVIETLKWCKENGISKIRINYDYQGIEKFATGEWKPKNEISRKYTEFVRKTGIDIDWRYIKSHTGNAKNEEADALAKKAAMESSQKPNKKIKDLELKALSFIDFINSKKDFSAKVSGKENTDHILINIVNKEKNISETVKILYEGAKKDAPIILRSQKDQIDPDISNLWQEFLFMEGFNIKF